jgi:hypothetical protein
MHSHITKNLYMFTYIQLYVYTYIYIYILIYIYIYIYIQIYTYTYMYTNTLTYIKINIHSHITTNLHVQLMSPNYETALQLHQISWLYDRTNMWLNVWHNNQIESHVSYHRVEYQLTLTMSPFSLSNPQTIRTRQKYSTIYIWYNVDWNFK